MATEERKRTPAEQKRKEAFEKVCAEMEENGYRRKEDLTAGVVKGNILSILIMLPFAALAAGLFFFVNLHYSVDLSLPLWKVCALLLAYWLLVAAHEAIHGLTGGFLAKSHFKAIRFGVIGKELTAYYTCSEPLSKWPYITVGAMPTLVLGFLPAAIATAIGSFWLFNLSTLMILVGGGDFYIIAKILSYKPESKEVLFYAHPYGLGIVAFEKA